MALTTVLEEATHQHRFQIVQCGDAQLLLRFAAIDGAERDSAFASRRKRCAAILRRKASLPRTCCWTTRPPRPDRRSGKLRQVVVEAAPLAGQCDGDASVAAREEKSSSGLPPEPSVDAQA